MPHFSRTRSVLGRTVAVSALTLVAGGLLAACGSDDSSATGSPTSSSASPTTSAAVKSGASQTPAAPPVTVAGDAATAPVEEPQALPSDFPGPTEIPLSPRGQAFLDALQKEGITPAAGGVIAISTADYICAAQQQGSSPGEVTTFVTAAVGSEATAAGQQLSADQAAKNAQVYIRVAQAQYCK
ncbi:DUF732 domain-containing protein [Rhodococcus sp. ABRD24]|uniref:DUF732 domain-containing protein n=1 Tax=Rhodococcus sp. ABRD24 TaxID=2507582 RepID=UPI00103C10B2|nr:DUF732 domain-containing protein [Rhodococcus sp. ABRD24]QBJ96692.1 DUF732 domain-containing protein [Rhodococcus sp. ABRD24]